MLRENQKTNILIIDDNPKNIQLAANVLKTTDLFNIFFATDGRSGINQLTKKEYALSLLDINMPELEGYETAKIIRENPRTENIPIIFLSANADHASINTGFEHGGQDYITKPFQQYELIQRVKTHVELFLAKQELQSEVDESHVLLEQYKAAIDISSLVSKTDTKGIITYVNEPFCKVSQYSKEELLGKSNRVIKQPNTPKEVFTDMWDTITQKKGWKGTVENKKKDGSSYFVNAVIIPILNHSDEIIEYISVRTDITKEIEAKERIISSQKEILYTLGEMGELRSRETGDHVKRVALYSELLANKYGLSSKRVTMLKMASPMHDIGKIGIPDAILNKPGKHTPEEWAIMQTHAQLGYDMLKNSKRRILRAGAIIARDHHEKWTGGGYPRNLKGEDIHIYGRISAVADVFDALGSDRCYKKAWPMEKVIDLFKEERGRHFDPQVVDSLLNKLDRVIAICDPFAE